MDIRSFVLPLPKQSKNILPTRLNQNHSKPIMKQKEKLKQFLEDLKNNDELLEDFIKRVDND